MTACTRGAPWRARWGGDWDPQNQVVSEDTVGCSGSTTSRYTGRAVPGAVTSEATLLSPTRRTRMEAGDRGKVVLVAAGVLVMDCAVADADALELEVGVWGGGEGRGKGVGPARAHATRACPPPPNPPPPPPPGAPVWARRTQRHPNARARAIVKLEGGGRFSQTTSKKRAYSDGAHLM